MAADSDGDTHISIPVGIIVGLLASFVQSLGLTIQRKSHVLNQSLPEEQQRVEHRRPLWLLGFAIFISSNLFGSVFQIASLPVVILAPLGAVSLLWNAFFARILLGDVFSVWMLIGTLLIAGGAVLIAIFGIVPEPTHSLEDLLELFNRPVFIVYFSLLGMAIVVCLAISHIVEYSYTRKVALPDVSPPLSPLVLPSSQPSMLTNTTTASHAVDPSERTPLLDRKPHIQDPLRSKSPSPSGTFTNRSILSNAISYTTNSPRTPILLAASYASFSGIISGMCLLFAKSGVELLMLTFGGDNQFWRWQAWILLLSLGVCALLQLWYMHKSLVLADPTVVCPLAFCFYNLSSIINGLVYFDQFSLLSKLQLGLVLLGIAILLSGVWIVSFPPTGGYSIDVGAWTKDDHLAVEDESDAEEDLGEPHSDEEHSDHDDEPLPMGNRRRSRTVPLASHPSGERISMELVPSDVQIITQPPEPVTPPRVSSSPTSLTFPPRGARGSRTESTLHPTDTSVRRSRSSYGTESPTRPSGSRRRRTTLASATSPPQVHAQFPGPLSPNAPTLGGFSIGLSPISPGFALVPTSERGWRRRTFVGDEEGGRRVRRLVSEGDVLEHLRSNSDMSSSAGRGGRWRDRREEGDEERGRGREGEALLPSPPAQGRRAKGRWRWLRGMFGR